MSFSSRTRTVALAAVALSAAAVFVAQSASARPLPPRVPKTWEIKMMTDNGMQKFEPKEITIQSGDIVKWVATSGNHNVSFWEDSIPSGAAGLLRKAMAADTIKVGEMGYFTLTTHRHPTMGDSIVVSFAGMPKGVYKYNCRPHLMRGMVAMITVQ